MTLKPDFLQGTISTFMHLSCRISVKVHPSISNPKFAIYVGPIFGHSSATHIHPPRKSRDDFMVISFPFTYKKDK